MNRNDPDSDYLTSKGTSSQQAIDQSRNQLKDGIEIEM